MTSLKNAMITLFALAFFSMPALAGNSASVDLSQYTVVLCGKVSNDVLSDVITHEKIHSPSGMVDLMMLISNDDPDAISYDRVVADGKVIFKGEGTVKLDASFIMTLDKGVHNDTVTYMYINNKRVGGGFYNHVSDAVKPEEIYISSAGSVYHINIEKISDQSCLDKFK